jgi:hypothetical protein
VLAVKIWLEGQESEQTEHWPHAGAPCGEPSDASRHRHTRPDCTGNLVTCLQREAQAEVL